MAFPFQQGRLNCEMHVLFLVLLEQGETFLNFQQQNPPFLLFFRLDPDTSLI